MKEERKDFLLTRDEWHAGDKADFVAYVNSLGDEKRARFEQKIMNTSLKCIGVSSSDIDGIVKKITKGNYLSFIDLWITDNYSCLLITGKSIAKIKDFLTFKRYMLSYVDYVDCWGGCDCLRFKASQRDTDDFLAFAKELTQSEKTFARRIGLVMMLKIVNDKSIDGILDVCSGLSDETEYYVNMANAWLVSECFVRNRDKTMSLLRSGKLNRFVQNRAVSKCRDSFRVSASDKEILLGLRK